MSALVHPSHLAISLNLGEAQKIKSRILQASRSKNTMKGYRSAWKIFCQWCSATEVCSLPATPQTCIDFAAWSISQRRKVATIEHRLKAVDFYHTNARLARPMDASVRSFLRNAKRDLHEQPRGKCAITPKQLQAISAVLLRRNQRVDIRDRALILLGFAAGFRRSEIVSLDLQDVLEGPLGLTLQLGRSKTDQYGHGRIVGIHRGLRRQTCPIAAMQDWLVIRGRWSGPLFTRTGKNEMVGQNRLHSDAVRIAVHRALGLIGEDSANFGAHSLRVGMITAAIDAGASETAVMQRTGHRRYEMIRRYCRPVRAFAVDPLKGIL